MSRSMSRDTFLRLSSQEAKNLLTFKSEQTREDTEQESLEFSARGLMTLAPSLVGMPTGYDSAYLESMESVVDVLIGLTLAPDRFNQASCEACTVCIMFDLLGYRPPDRFIVWLEKLLRYPLVDNNWQWFGAIIAAYIKKHGGAASYTSYLHRIDTFYVDRGWYLDGNKYDMYSGWVMQFLPHFFARLVPEQAEYYLRDHDVFLQDWASLFSETGRNVQWGRSQIYKYAASNPFVACWFNPAYESDVTYSDLVLANVLSYPESLCMGVIAPGDCEIDSYSCKYSPLWANSTLLAAMLPEDSKFFTGKQATNWWTRTVHIDRDHAPLLHIIDGQPNDQHIYYGKHVASDHTNLDKRYIFNDR